MTSPKHAIATESGRYYSIPGYEDTPFRSVTNIIGVLDKPAIAGAAAKRAGERAVFQETEWHAIQQEQGDEKARLWISGAMREYGKYAADCGSAVHFCCEHFDGHVDVVEGEAVFDSWLTDYLVAHWATAMCAHRDTVDKNVERIRKHVTQFARAVDEHGIVFLDRERTVCNPELGYAGTLDAVVQLDGAMRRYVLDIKTGGVYPESVALQLASYRYATHEVHGDTTTKRDYAIDGGIVLQLKPASYSMQYVRCDRDVFSRFLSAMNLWEWKNEESRNALGEEWR